MFSQEGIMYEQLKKSNKYAADGQYRFINQDTLYSLQIVGNESHPNVQNQGPSKSRSGSKEGFSLFGLFQQFARTPQGKVQLRQYFLRPSVNMAVINERLRAITAFLLPSNSALLEELPSSLRAIKNMRTVLKNLRKGVISPTRHIGSSIPIWSTLIQFVFHAMKIRDIFREMDGAEQVHIRHKVLQHFSGEELARVGQSIFQVIDIDESRNNCRVVVHTNVDPRLDALKEQHAGLDSALEEVAKVIRSCLPVAPANLDDKVDVAYYPRIGFVVMVSIEYAGTLESVLQSLGSPWQHVFNAE
jgi:DNA mismatch repair protein MSH5